MRRKQVWSLSQEHAQDHLINNHYSEKNNDFRDNYRYSGCISLIIWVFQFFSVVNVRTCEMSIYVLKLFTWVPVTEISVCFRFIFTISCSALLWLKLMVSSAWTHTSQSGRLGWRLQTVVVSGDEFLLNGVLEGYVGDISSCGKQRDAPVGFTLGLVSLFEQDDNNNNISEIFGHCVPSLIL